MPEEVKILTTDDLERLRTLQLRYDGLIKQYGEVHLQKKLLDVELSTLDTEFDELETKRVATMTEFEKKYGVGSVDMESGVFTPQFTGGNDSI